MGGGEEDGMGGAEEEDGDRGGQIGWGQGWTDRMGTGTDRIRWGHGGEDGMGAEQEMWGKRGKGEVLN